MFKVTLKRYGFIKWDGHQHIPTLIRASITNPEVSMETKDKFARDNSYFISTLKTLKGTTFLKPSQAEAAAGLSWTTEILLESQSEANALAEYYGVKVQERLNVLDPNSGLVIEATITQV